jgi:TolB-like protein
LAEPGGVCVSEMVYRSVKAKLDLGFEDLGEKEVKNIEEPVRVYRVVHDSPISAVSEPASASSSLPDKPSIAVLPFTNMSGDPDQDYFSDGMTEDIITELSRFRRLFVIARNSSFVFKGLSVDIKEVGRKLGAAYVVEGSIRKVGSRVRVTAQLIEVATGNHIWAERYDRELQDIFTVQDELVHEIVAAIPGQLNLVALQSARRRSIDNMSAYDLLLKGEWVTNQQGYNTQEPRTLFERAIELDPQCARAHARLAAFHAYSVFAHGSSSSEAAHNALLHSEKALEIDPTEAAIHGFVAFAHILLGEHELARWHVENAIKLNPNDFLVMFSAGIVLGYLGSHEEGLEWEHQLMLHDPIGAHGNREIRFDIAYMMRRYEDAISVTRGWRDPPVHMHAEFAAAYAQGGLPDQMSVALETLHRNLPDSYNIPAVCYAHARMCARKEDHDHWLEGYRKAGLIP